MLPAATMLLQTGMIHAYVADPPLMTVMTQLKTQIEPTLGPL